MSLHRFLAELLEAALIVAISVFISYWITTSIHTECVCVEPEVMPTKHLIGVK